LLDSKRIRAATGTNWPIPGGSSLILTPAQQKFVLCRLAIAAGPTEAIDAQAAACQRQWATPEQLALGQEPY